MNLPRVKFYLKDLKSVRPTLVYMNVNYEGLRLRLSVGVSILPSFWDTMNQRVCRSFQNSLKINQVLNRFEETMIEQLAIYCEDNFFPNPTKIKETFFDRIKVPTKSKYQKSLWYYFDIFLKIKEQQNEKIDEYKYGLKKHLLAVEKLMKKVLSFRMIEYKGSGFYETWMHYLSKIAVDHKGNKGLHTNTIGKCNKSLKCFLNWIFDQKLYERFSLKEFVSYQEETDSVYLTERELELLDSLVLEDSLDDKMRDLFLIGCETALRLSDLLHLSSKNIIGDEIHDIPSKTKKYHSTIVRIPISARVKRILEKYGNNFPHIEKKYKKDFNPIIKKICKLAQIDTPVLIIKNKRNGEVEKINFLKYELIESRTCRRTFATLKFLKKMPVHAIMKFTNHSTEKSFLRYLKLDAELAAKEFKSYF